MATRNKHILKGPGKGLELMRGLIKDSWKDLELVPVFRTVPKICLRYLQQITPIHTFFYKQHFYKKHQTEIAKNQANAKQHPEAEVIWLMKLYD